MEFVVNMDLQEVLSYVLGAEDVIKAKPNPEPVLKTLEKFGCTPDEALVVGDTWYDIDYQNVIKLRNLFYTQRKKYQMIGSSVLDYDWMEQIKVSNNILIVAEGLMMYLSETEIKDLLKQISSKFKKVHLIFDSYSKMAVKLSRIKNPVNQVGAKVKYGIDTPKDFLKLNHNLKHINTYTIKRQNNNLSMLTRFIFNNLYCGKISQSLYKIYEFSL